MEIMLTLEKRREKERKMAEEAKKGGKTPSIDETYKKLQEENERRSRQNKGKLSDDEGFYKHTKCQTLF